jgi:hypothetical protein
MKTLTQVGVVPSSLELRFALLGIFTGHENKCHCQPSYDDLAISIIVSPKMSVWSLLLPAL